MIDESHYELLADHGTRVATVLTINLDVNSIVGVHTFYEYEGTIVAELCSPNPQMDRYDRHHTLLKYYGEPVDVIQTHVDDIIDDQKQSDDPTPFTWELFTGSERIETDNGFQELLETVVSPERLDPPFEIPDGKQVVTVSCTTEQHNILQEANDRYGYADVSIKRFRGETYLIGLTRDRAATLSKGCVKLKREYNDMDMHDSARAANKAESIVYNAGEDVTDIDVSA